MEAAECGAAALGIILEFHGRYVPLDILREDCGVSRDGSNALYIKEAAKRYGLEVKAFRKPAEGLPSRRPPFVVFWQWNHFLVVEGFARGRVFLNDPAIGRRSVSQDEFQRGYSGIAFTFEPGPQFVKEGRRPSAVRGLVRRLWTSKAALVFVVLAGLAMVVPNLVSAAFQRIFIDDILIERRLGWLKLLLFAMAVTALARLAAAWLQQLYLNRLEIRLALVESVEFLWHVLRLPVTFFQRRWTGDIVNRAASTARVAQLMSGELATTAASLLTLIAYVAVMLPYEARLAAVGVVVGSLNLVVLQWFGRWRIDRNRAIEQIRGRLVAGVMWAIQIIESVKATGSESDLLVRWTGDQARMINEAQTLGVCDVVLFAVPPFLGSLTAIAVLGLGGQQVIFGELSIGLLVAFQALLAGFNQPFRDLARLAAQVQELRADLDRIDDVRNRPIDPVFGSAGSTGAEGIPGAPAGSGPEPLRLNGQLEFRRVTFGYNRSVEEPLLKDFSFVAKPGQRIALVGSSGSGKSTIGRLAAGLYQPWSGEILYDGKALAEIPRAVFVNSVELVDSEISLFEGSVRDNLTLWDNPVPSERLIQAGVDAAIHRDLLGRRGGYEASVAEQGRNFSGGQRQRLQIARALVRDPTLLILDEATSALDPKTERIVDDHLRRRGGTCLIIAHRLTTIRDCDEIIVLSGGRVVQRGTHDELITDEQGEYARLVSHQALPGPQSGIFSWARHRMPARTMAGRRDGSNEEIRRREAPTSEERSSPSSSRETEPPRFIVEELIPYSRPERAAANLPLPLDDVDAVWWVASGGVDVFFTALESGASPGPRRHLCRVEEGGSIFAISGVRGRSGGGLVAVGAGQAQLLKFARGELIRLSFEEGLAEQVAVLIDDWVLRVSRALGQSTATPPRRELQCNAIASLEPGARFGIRQGIAWVRHLCGTSLLLDRLPLPDTEFQARFPLSEHLWLTAANEARVTACDTEAMIHMGDPWTGLDHFHRTVLDFIAAVDEQETQARWVEFQRSSVHEAAVLGSVSKRIAAAADEAAVSDVEAEGDPLVAACRTIGQFLGVEVQSPQTAGASSNGASHDPLGDLARASGFHVRVVTLEEGWWKRRGGEPLLSRLTREGNPPVALLPAAVRTGISGPAYEMVDSAGKRTPVDRELAPQIGPTAWVFYRTLPDQPLAISDLVRFSLSLRNLPRELGMVLAMAFVGAVFGLSIPIASGILVDQVIPAADGTGLAIMCLFLIVLASAAAIFQVMEGLLVLRIEGRVSGALIPAVWDRLLRLPSRFFARFSSGDMALRAMELSEVFKRVSGAAASTVVAGLFSLFNLALLFYYSWRMALGATLLLGVMFLVMALLLAGLVRQETAIRKIDGLTSGLLLELFGGILSLRTAGAESRAFARWANCYAERLALAIRARRFSKGIHQWLAVYPILTAMVVYVGTVRLDPGLMRTGSFLAFNIAFANLVAAFLAVGYTSISLLELLPMCERIRPILEERPEFAAAVAEPFRLAGALALNHVSFRYPGQDQGTRVLDDVSLQVRPGEFVAIVGPSGAGKSTLMRLLLGFETPAAGTVTYDGRELATLDLRDVRRQIGVVLQHAQLMPSDIFNNIVGFAPHLSMDDAWQAARLAGLEDEIRSMPMGMYTLVGEAGGNLSSGQRQRLLIARAIVHRPKILLLDEATSALDNVTQATVSDSLTNQLRGMTRVVIAHRLDAVVNADRIYVLTDGRIVQSGRYQELLEEPGPFRELARRQIL
jgi:NHLM bacteriocin system ABC transporter peptidase/ATP-binding protein/NHLM bacteriocin system ABC transporter ATP-binding protein